MTVEEFVDIVCPRCQGFIPRNDVPGVYPGALSRTDNKTEICSPCGEEEAIMDWLDGGATPKDRWPLGGEDTYESAGARERFLNRMAIR